VQEAVRREEVRPNRQTQLGAALLEPDELDPEKRRKRPLGRRLDGRGVYLPARDETYLATARICASLSTPLKAGMIPPPC
jgi:hypothetical protein